MWSCCCPIRADTAREIYPAVKAGHAHLALTSVVGQRRAAWFTSAPWNRSAAVCNGTQLPVVGRGENVLICFRSWTVDQLDVMRVNSEGGHRALEI